MPREKLCLHCGARYSMGVQSYETPICPECGSGLWGYADQPPVEVAVRADGDVIVLYTQETETPNSSEINREWFEQEWAVIQASSNLLRAAKNVFIEVGDPGLLDPVKLPGHYPEVYEELRAAIARAEAALPAPAVDEGQTE